MGERNQERKEKYKRVRTDFEDLEIEDKALFLLEATVATVARGIEQIGRGFAEEFDKACRRAARWPTGDEPNEHTNGTGTSESGGTEPPSSESGSKKSGTDRSSPKREKPSSEADSDSPSSES